MTKLLVDVLKTQVKNPLQSAKQTWHQYGVSLENDIEDLKEILKCVQSNSITFKSNDNTARNQISSCEDVPKEVPKKRGRPAKSSTVPSEPRDRCDSNDSLDSTASTSSSRSRRVAAQAAEHKMAKVNSLVQLKTKLRRPTNFDEKQNIAVPSPPTKCRRTRRNQSAGSSSPQADENMVVVDNGDLAEECLSNDCLVYMKKFDTPTIKSFTHPKSRSSRSLDRASGRNSKDLFNESGPLSELNKKTDVAQNSSDPTHRTIRKKSLSKKDLDSGISSTEEELQQLMKQNLPIAQSSPIVFEPFDGEFKGFVDQLRENKAELQAAPVSENTFIVGTKTDKTLVVKLEKRESSVEEIEITEVNVVKSKSKTLRKRVTQSTTNLEEKENVNRNDETRIITTSQDDSPYPLSQTQILKKAGKNIDGDENNSEEELDSQSSPELKVRSRTKTIKKHNEQELKSDSEISGKNVRSRTKTMKINKEKEAQSDSSDNELNKMRSRTKTIRKGTNNMEANGFDSECLISELKDNPSANKLNNRFPPLSPAPAKGELVKKRVEDFEKMQNGMEEEVFEEEKVVGRVTRNAMKSKVTSTATEAQSSKQVRTMMQLPASLKKNLRKSVGKAKRNKVKEEKENIPLAKLQASAVKPPLTLERPRMTPLGVNNRMTPASDPALKAQANKWTNSANHAVPVEANNVALIHKQATEEAEKKRKEEERLKRQAKEEEAKKKKEKALKATAEEARRKRAEKMQKVAATREAAEKEKERLAAKAEKEKEEKMRQIALEKKEKQKEEMLKKKQLMQQKTLENEERRKQEEAARLAKLREQEEEHNRLLAMKEREQELLKQQKAEQRLAEAEKTKHQGGKLGKIAAVNNAKSKMQHGMTPSDKTNAAQSSTCYEITPAREDRPLLPPKTENDYGIDDAHSEDSSDEESQPRKVIPAWAQSKNRERLLKVNKYIPKQLWDLFMVCDPCPDINQMFAGNPIKRRIRTSSAVWRTPPKYSRIAPK